MTRYASARAIQRAKTLEVLGEFLTTRRQREIEIMTKLHGSITGYHNDLQLDRTVGVGQGFSHWRSNQTLVPTVIIGLEFTHLFNTRIRKIVTIDRGTFALRVLYRFYLLERSRTAKSNQIYW